MSEQEQAAVRVARRLFCAVIDYPWSRFALLPILNWWNVRFGITVDDLLKVTVTEGAANVLE